MDDVEAEIFTDEIAQVIDTWASSRDGKLPVYAPWNVGLKFTYRKPVKKEGRYYVRVRGQLCPIVSISYGQRAGVQPVLDVEYKGKAKAYGFGRETRRGWSNG